MEPAPDLARLIEGFRRRADSRDPSGFAAFLRRTVHLRVLEENRVDRVEWRWSHR